MSSTSSYSIIFLYYRAGSTLFEAMIGKPWRVAQLVGDYTEAIRLHQEWKDNNGLFYLPTVESCISYDVSFPFQETLTQEHQGFYWNYIMHIGEWWGQLPSHQIPEWFEGDSPARWGPEELGKLPDTYNWNFTALIRDGRNQIASLRAMKGGIEEERNKQNPQDYFIALCKSYRNKARVLLENSKRFPFSIFKFEDFVEQPKQITFNLLQSIGLSPIKEKIGILIPSWWQQKHSSFTNQQYNTRYLQWTHEERQIFNEIAGKEQEELGYDCFLL